MSTLYSFAHAESLFTYTPPKSGAPSGRLGGGTRGIDIDIFNITLIAPQYIAFTSQSQPKFYWYLVQEKQKIVKFTLFREGSIQPLLEKKLLSNTKTKLQSLNLRDYGIFLNEGEEYYWSVTIIDSGTKKTNMASAIFQYKSIPTPLLTSKKLAKGYWYDELQKLIEAQSPLTNDFLKQSNINVKLLNY